MYRNKGVDTTEGNAPGGRNPAGLGSVANPGETTTLKGPEGFGLDGQTDVRGSLKIHIKLDLSVPLLRELGTFLTRSRQGGGYTRCRPFERRHCNRSAMSWPVSRALSGRCRWRFNGVQSMM